MRYGFHTHILYDSPELYLTLNRFYKNFQVLVPLFLFSDTFYFVLHSMSVRSGAHVNITLTV